jgi:hypothetical protein
MFQYKILHNTVFLKSRLYHLGHSTDSYCSLCDIFDETPVHSCHFFCNCLVTMNLWSSLCNLLRPHRLDLILEPLSPQSAILGLFSDNDKNYLLRNHVLLLFKYCMYKYRTDNINIHTIVGKIKSTLNIEKQIFSTEKFNKKWAIILPILN